MSLALLCALGLTLAWAASPAGAATATFGYTGGEQAFVVPSGVSKIHVLAVGGSGGGGDVSGGAGAEVSADLAVTPGQVLHVEVGGTGEDSGEGGEGGFNGGAAGGSASGGGGGASDLRLLPLSSGLITDTRLIVAGGAGGGGGPGEDCGGGGGDAGSAGGASCSWEGGGAGTESAGGAGGGGCGLNGESGQLGQGGIGGFGESGNNGGGGGGGGYYGGGGGGGGCVSGGGGGGGGSSLVPAGGKLEIALPSASPQIQISYTPPPPVIPPVVASPTPPGTVLGTHPKKNLKTTKKRVGVKFSFSSPAKGATFKCKLDKAAFSPCASPKSYKVKAGKHKFSVEAVSGGLTDPTPAVFGFKVTKTP
jgi:hypothetical protein